MVMIDKKMLYLMCIPVFGVVINYVYIFFNRSKIEKFTFQTLFLYVFSSGLIWLGILILFLLGYSWVNQIVYIRDIVPILMIIPIIIGGLLMGLPVLRYYKKYKLFS